MVEMGPQLGKKDVGVRSDQVVSLHMTTSSNKNITWYVHISPNSNLSGTQTRRNGQAHNLKTHLATSQLVTNLEAKAVIFLPTAK